MKAITGLRVWVYLGLLIFSTGLCRAQAPELVVQIGHSDPVNSVSFSPDGRLVASGSRDKTIKLWDIKSGEELRTLTGHSASVESVAFSVSGTTVASGSDDLTIKLWDIESGTELKTLLGHRGAINSVTFTSDGKTLASGSNDNTIKLWDVKSGKELRTLKGHSGWVNSVSFTPDGKTLASGSNDNTIKLWDVKSGKELKALKGHDSSVNSVIFSSDGTTLASGDSDKTIKLWEAKSGKELRTLSWHATVSSSSDGEALAFGLDGKTLVSGGSDNIVRLWGLESGEELGTFSAHSDAKRSEYDEMITSISISPDGKTLVSGNWDQTIKLWDVESRKELRTLSGHVFPVGSVAFSPSRKLLAAGSHDNTIKLWNLESGSELRTLSRHSDIVSSVSFSSDSETIASAGTLDSIIKLWDIESGKELRSLQVDSFYAVASVSFSPGGNMLASGGFDKTVKLWDVDSGKLLKSLNGHSGVVNKIGFSPVGKILVSGSADKTIKLWNIETGEELRTLKGHAASVNSVSLSLDGKILASGGSDKTIKLWDIESGRELITLKGHSSEVFSVSFNPDGEILASGSFDNTIKLWDVTTGKILRTLIGHSDFVMSVVFSPSGTILASGGADGKIKLWDVATGGELGSLIALDNNEWVVIDRSGRFDASPGAQKLMSWRVGTGIYDIIGLEQLKERYYEPGLLAKLMGFNRDPLRNVSKFVNPTLNPDIKYEPITVGGSNLNVSLFNRGGGIGRVQIFVNGKEFLADARDERLRQNPNVAQATLNVDLSNATGALIGKDNDVRIVAWNVENYISSRGTELVWTAGGPAERAPPEVYAIIGGISNFAGSQLNLNFAAKDAIDIANAIELGAKRLFGADKVHLTLLSTAEDQRALAPTKNNFQKAFARARQAKPTDILIVYLAGHGITLQRGSDMYCYLTQEARTTDTATLSDSAVRQQQAITSEELIDWIKQIPALKQVVVLDTCAAGAAQAHLRLVDKREGSGDAIRAIDRAKDRTGSYILMGSAADAVSYEASQYGQGLLTYALLKGMKGAALRNDEFIDVSKLFQYAREEVEQMAKNIGGIQRPIIFAPKDDSFEVGQLTREDKQRIALATPKPMILRPRFFDAQVDDDTLDLMRVLRARLRDESGLAGRGIGVLVFVDEEEFPSGIRPTGRYTIEGNKVTVRLRLRRDGIEIANTQVIGTKDEIADLAEKILAAIKGAISKL